MKKPSFCGKINYVLSFATKWVLSRYTLRYIMNRIKEKKTYHTLFCFWIAFFPLIEVYRSFFGHKIQIAGIALEEMVIFLVGGILFAAGIFFSLREKKRFPLILTGIWVVLFVVYALFHSWNAAHFNPAILPDAQPSFFREIYYVGRMYFFPTSLIFSALLLALPKEKLLKGLMGSAWVITLCIVIPNLFGFSFCSYQDGNVLVENSIFSWFRLPKDAVFSRYTTKGIFSSANDLAAVLFGITPFVTFSAFHDKKIRSFILLFLIGLSSIMVGTKISSLGFFLALSGSLILELICFFFRHKKNFKVLFAFGAIFLVLLSIFLISPGRFLQQNRETEKETVNQPTQNENETDSKVEENVLQNGEKLEDYLETHYWDHLINPWFLKLYPVENDPEFWNSVVLRHNSLNSDSRVFKLEMIGRIREQNGRELDRLLGIGFTSGVPYAERDYFYQNYLFGSVGLVLLLFPFVAAFLLSVKDGLLHLFRKKDFLIFAIPALSLLCFFAAAYYAGHVFDTIFTTYFLAFAAAYVACHQKAE